MSESSSQLSALSGPAAMAASFHDLETHVQQIVRIGIVRTDFRGDIAQEIAALHERVARMLDDVVREYGTDTMKVAADYAVAALEAGLIYVNQELGPFLMTVAQSVRSTGRQLIKTGGGSVAG